MEKGHRFVTDSEISEMWSMHRWKPETEKENRKKKEGKSWKLETEGENKKSSKLGRHTTSCPEWFNQIDTPDPPVLVLFVIASLQLLRAGVFKQVGHNVIKQYGTKKSLVPQIEATARTSGWAGRWHLTETTQT